MTEQHFTHSYSGNVYLLMPVLIPAGRGLFAGGNMNSMVGVGSELASRGYRMHIITGNYHNALNDARECGLDWATVYPVGLHPDRRGFSRGVEFLGKAAIRIVKHVKAGNSGIFHIHSGYPQFGYLCGLSRVTKKVRTIQTVYCPIRNRVDDRHYWGLSPSLVRHALSSNDAIVAISHNLKKGLLEIGVPESRIWVIPPSVNCKSYGNKFDTGKIRKKLDIQQNIKLLVYSGNATRTKGLDVLVESYIRLRKSMHNVHLVFALQHQYSKDAEAAIGRLEKELDREAGPQSYTRLGIVDNMPKLIAAADVFVSPLRDTNGPADYPLSIMEAMAARKCVITTRVGGTPEFLIDGVNGRMVPPGDVSQLENALREVLSEDRMREELGRQAAIDIRANYTPSRIADMTEELYRSVRKLG